MAVSAQLRLSGGDPRADTLSVVSEDFVTSTHHLCSVRTAAFGLPLQEVPPVVALVRRTVQSVTKCRDSDVICVLAVDYLP